MQIYEPGQDVTVTLSFLDGLGDAVTPTALDYQVADETGTLVVALTNIPVFVATDGQHSIDVLAASNTLAAGSVRGYRQVELRITAGTDTFWVRDGYILELASPLVVLTNSLVTEAEATLMSRGLANLDGWEAASDQHKVSALQQAYDHLHAYSYRFDYTDGTYEVKPLSDLTSTEWGLLSARQISDFKKAQIVQADYLLGGSPIERDIEQGLQSSTIGEVSQFYRPRPTMSLTLSKDAIKYVGRYISWSLNIARA